MSHLLYIAAGSPVYPANAPGMCRVCGTEASGVRFSAWVRDTFTDHDKLKPGEIICQACQFSFAEASELLAQRVGKENPQRMRNYSHFVVAGAWHPLNKGQKREMRDLLLQSPSLAVIAESGQKHLLFRAKPGWLQFEEQSILPDVERWKAAQEIVDALYLGFTKSEIETGRYGQHRIRQFGVARWHVLEQQIRPLRGSLLFQLAIFLAQKEEDYGASGDSGKATLSPVAGDTGRVQKQVRPEHLGAIPESDQERGVHQSSFDFL